MNRTLAALLTLVLATTARGAVEVTFATKGGSIDSAITLDVAVRSTDTTPREVLPLRIRVPSEILLGTRPKPDPPPLDSIQTSERETRDLDPGGTIQQSLHLPPLTLRETLAPRALFYRSEDLSFDTIAVYTEAIAGRPTEIRQKHTVRITGPLLGIAAGGTIGVVLAVLLTWAYAKSKNLPVPPWKQQLLTILTGILTVTIIALIRNADTALLKTVGVIVAIYDYRGGILAGLLFQPIAKKLIGWISGDTNTAGAPAPAPAPAP